MIYERIADQIDRKKRRLKSPSKNAGMGESGRAMRQSFIYGNALLLDLVTGRPAKPESYDKG